MITFTSEPPLPQDEVLARILFNRATANLSPFQVAQLAAAAAELAGGGGNGLLSQLRSATGLDDLDIITEDDGSTAVRAGRYLDENVYVDVQHDTEGVSRAELSLETGHPLFRLVGSEDIIARAVAQALEHAAEELSLDH